MFIGSSNVLCLKQISKEKVESTSEICLFSILHKV